jgi:hypothetical protein
MNPAKRLTLADYLVHLEKTGIEKGYFEVYAIKDVHKTCCSNAVTKVIDFDKVKEKLTKVDDWVTVASCDCLKLLPEKGQVDFIEMKGFKQFIAYFKKDNDLEKGIVQQIDKHNFLKKIKDSLHIFETLVRKNAFGRSDLDEIHYDNIAINYIVLTDIDAVQDSFNYIALSFIFLSQYSTSIENSIKAKMTKKLHDIPKLRPNLNPATLKSCSEIDTFYNLKK